MKSLRNIFTTAVLALAVFSSCTPEEEGVGIVAHRGFWNCEEAGFSQNSIASLICAQKAGVWGSEFDVFLTADDQLVINHDAVFQGLEIEASTYEQVRELRLKNGEQVPNLPAQPVFWQWQNTLSFLHAVHLRSHLRPARSYQHRTHNPAAHHDVSRCVCIHPTVSAATESDHTSDCIPVLRYCFHDVWSLPVHLLPSSCQNRYISGSTILYGHGKTRQDLHCRIFCTSFCSPPANICPAMRPFPYKKAERQFLSAQCRFA